MQIPSINNFFTSEAPYFLESSWKGRVIQVLCLVSFLYLIFTIAFRLKKTGDTSSKDSPTLEGRISQNSEPDEKAFPSALQVQPFATDLDSHPSKTPETPVKTGDKIRVITFRVWLSEKIQVCDHLQQDSLQDEIHELKAQLEIMIPIFQAHPEVQTEDWDVFLKECDAIAESHLEESNVNLRSCLAKLQSWSTALRRHLAKKAAEEPDFWELYHFVRLLNASIVTCGRLIGQKKDPSKITMTAYESLIDQKKRSHIKPLLYTNALMFFIQELQIQIEKMKPIFQSCAEDRKRLFRFNEVSYSILDSEVSKKSCRDLKRWLVFLESRIASLVSRYEIKKSFNGPDFMKAFLKYFRVWLPEKIESCDYITPLALGRALQSKVCSRVFKIFIEELIEQVGKMILVFQTYSEIKTEDLTAFIIDCHRLMNEEGELKERCLSLKRSLEKLQFCLI